MDNSVIIDYRMDKLAIDKLSEYFKTIVKTRRKNTYNAICGHADISLCKISNKEIVVCPSDYEYYKDSLSSIIVYSGLEEPKCKYPFDVCYNAACFGNSSVHNFKYTDKNTLAVIEQKFSKRINVKQGYSKCSICGFENGSAITDDEGIYEALRNNGIDVLKISKGDVELPEMSSGFFGGATGVFNDKLFINGELKYHSDAKIIERFLIRQNIDYIEINKGKLKDVGSIICLG